MIVIVIVIDAGNIKKQFEWGKKPKYNNNNKKNFDVLKY